MPLQNLVEFLNRMVVVKIVEVVESGEVQRVIGAVGEHIGRAGRLSVHRGRRPSDEQEAQKRDTAGWEPGKHVRGLYLEGSWPSVYLKRVPSAWNQQGHMVERGGLKSALIIKPTNLS